MVRNVNAAAAMSEQFAEQKRQFAHALLRQPSEPFLAAKAVFPHEKDIALAVTVSYEWPNDPVVRQCMDEARQTKGDAAFLPTREETARKVWDKATAEGVSMAEFYQGMRLFSELQGFVKQPGTGNANVSVTMSNRVMVIPSHGNDDEWEQRVIAQQAKVIEHAKTAE